MSSHVSVKDASKAWKGVQKKLKKKVKGPFKYPKSKSHKGENDLLKLRKKLPFPVVKNFKLDYACTKNLTTGSGVFGTEKIFRLNSLYDVDYSDLGHQPYGYDQVAAIYNKYRVNAVKIEANFTNPSADGITCGLLITPPNDGTTIQGLSISTVSEKMFGVTKDVNNTGSQKVTIVGYMPMHKLLGITKQQHAGDTSQYLAAVSANPTLSPFARFAISNSDESSITSNTCTVHIKFRFYCTLYEPVVLAAS